MGTFLNCHWLVQLPVPQYKIRGFLCVSLNYPCPVESPVKAKVDNMTESSTLHAILVNLTVQKICPNASVQSNQRRDSSSDYSIMMQYKLSKIFYSHRKDLFFVFWFHSLMMICAVEYTMEKCVAVIVTVKDWTANI